LSFCFSIESANHLIKRLNGASEHFYNVRKNIPTNFKHYEKTFRKLRIKRRDFVRSLDKEAIENLAVGAAILGTGGGGDPYIGKLTAIQALEEGYEINVVDVEEVPKDALIIPSAGMVLRLLSWKNFPEGPR